jgi:hypothetical protein
MKVITAGVLSLVLVGIVAGSAGADNTRRKHRQHHDAYAQRYPNATPRQLHNLRAYERGEYYETYSDALPVGSRPWFEQKEREGGDRRF